MRLANVAANVTPSPTIEELHATIRRLRLRLSVEQVHGRAIKATVRGRDGFAVGMHLSLAEAIRLALADYSRDA